MVCSRTIAITSSEHTFHSMPCRRYVSGEIEIFGKDYRNCVAYFNFTRTKKWTCLLLLLESQLICEQTNGWPRKLWMLVISPRTKKKTHNVQTIASILSARAVFSVWKYIAQSRRQVSVSSAFQKYVHELREWRENRGKKRKIEKHEEHKYKIHTHTHSCYSQSFELICDFGSVKSIINS